jgi:hypothetical protein
VAETIGKVECIQVADDFSFVGIREDGTNDFEAFISGFLRVNHQPLLEYCTACGYQCCGTHSLQATESE